MRTFYDIAKQSPPTAEGLVNAAISAGIILIVILIAVIIRLWKGRE